MLISLRNVEKSYPHGVGRTYVLRRVNVDIKEGEFVSIMGPSGAGKSTALHILGMHDSAWSGEYYSHRSIYAALQGQGYREAHKIFANLWTCSELDRICEQAYRNGTDRA